MPGGQQVGGPVLKGTLSRLACRSLRTLAHVGTRDATNSFKAYSTEFVRQAGIHPRDGFEIGIELTAKAKRLRLKRSYATVGLDNFSKYGKARKSYDDKRITGWSRATPETRPYSRPCLTRRTGR